MYRNSSRFNVALVLGAPILTAIVLSGCVASTPAPQPTILQRGCGSRDGPCPDPPAGGSEYDVMGYIEKHYPEHAPRAAEWHYLDRRATPSGDVEVFMAGNWTMTCTLELRSSVVVANDVTGFRWMGTIAKLYSRENHVCCAETHLTELSVTLGKPKQ